MSEWDAHVHCTCFQDGLTTEPPYPRSELAINRFGVVTMVGSIDHSEDPENLLQWRWGYLDDWSSNGSATGSPCMHDGMKLVDVNPFYIQANWGRMEPAYPQVENILSAGHFPVLSQIFHRPQVYDFPSGGIWIPAGEATRALAELLRLLPQLPAELGPGDAHFIRTLQLLLEASAQTGNPIICHNNGVGDGAW